MTRFVHLPTSRRESLPDAAAADEHEIIEVTVLLRRRSSPARRIEAGTRLDRRDFVATFGARRRDIAALGAYAAAFGIQVVRSSKAARTVVLRGPLGAMCDAFRADVRRVEIDGAEYRRRAGDLAVPAELAGIVEGIFGFTNVPHARPRAAVRAGETWRPVVSKRPTELASLYNFPEGLDGSGECIGILQFGGGYHEKDLDRCFRDLGVPRPEVVAIPVGKGKNAPGGITGADIEVALDIQIAGAVAPGARIAVYFADWSERGWIDALDAAIHDTVNKPSVLSICWGWAELEDTRGHAWTKSAIDAVNALLEDAAMLGITVLVASGDDGSADGIDDRRAHVDFPASSPWVLACGGTDIDIENGAIVREHAWNDGRNHATGGGMSDAVDQPEWQSEAGVPVSVSFALGPRAAPNPGPASPAPGHRLGRGVPDVAGLAGGDHGFSVYLNGNRLSGVTGTSAVAPFYAGLIARINQSLGRRVGFLNPILYRDREARAALRDVTSGDNDVVGIGGYRATTGWDPCTGWGSIDGKKLLAALEALKPRVSHIEALKPAMTSEESMSIDESA